MIDQEKGPFILPNLPYEKKALEPYISEKTLEFHHGKHHQAYVNNLNALIENTDFLQKNLETVIKETFGKPDKAGIFNNAAQVWNHTFYWHSIKPNGGGSPSAKIAALIESSFGSMDALKDEFSKAAAGQFGSGWAWIVYDGKGLKVTKTSNAENPITSGMFPIITIDVWEHAYYLDYQNARPKYIETFFNHLINWDFAERCYDRAVLK